MATVPKQRRAREIEYPTGDGKPMAETELHLLLLLDTVEMLRDYYAAQSDVYVGGNLMVFFEERNRRKHVAPDAFVAIGVPKEPPRDHYLVWSEGKGPDLVIELTSKSTRRVDQNKKPSIYRDILRVTEYFLFDPTHDYLNPPLQGFRLSDGEYVPIEPVDGRLPSEVLGLHLERDGTRLRLFNPASGEYLMTRLEARRVAEHRAEAAQDRADAAHGRAEAAEGRAEAAQDRADAAQDRAEAAQDRAEAAEAERLRFAEENDRLRREIERLRGGPSML